MTCEQCNGTDFAKILDFELDPPFPMIIGTEYKCVSCGDLTCLLKRNMPFPPLLNTFG